MKTIKATITGLTFLLTSATFAKPTADIAILLDTSGSMQGLINQVRDGLWQTLNSLGEIKKNGEVADLKLALYEYGSGSVSEEANFIQMLVPLTTDHTKIAEKLFATKATGGSEYSGHAIKQATEDLKWSELSSDFKSIVIAGNETIHQGPTSPIEASAASKSQDIIINSIFAGSQTVQASGFGCGFFCSPNASEPNESEVKPNPIFLEWKEMASAGGGKTLNIDSNNTIPYVESPFDSRIVEVTKEINLTFLPFGQNGQTEYQRMLNLDRQINRSGAGSYIGWGDYRSGNFGQANTSTWDLVSAFREENFDITKVAENDLPESLQGLSAQEKIDAIKSMDLKRNSLENEAQELRKKRKEFVDAWLTQNQEEGEANFAEAIREILTKQLKAKGFLLSPQ